MLKTILKFLSRKKKARAQVIRTQGNYYNLKEVYDRINKKYFNQELNLAITWFSPKKTKYRRRILLGIFYPHRNLIKVNRFLDGAETPSYFVDFIVYHEMLHFVLPPVIRRGQKKRIHHHAFKEREKLFEDYTLAQEYREKSKEGWFIG
jgi:hypothetical protein